MAYSNQTPALLAGIPPALPPRDRALSWACSLCVHTLALAVAAVSIRGLPPAPAPVYRMEILLSEARHEAEQPTAVDSPAQTDPTTLQETAALTEDASPIVPASPSSIARRTAQRATAETPPPAATDKSSETGDQFPVESSEPIEQLSEPSASVTEAVEQTVPTTTPSSPSESLENMLVDVAESSSQQETSSSPPIDTTPQTPLIDSQTGSSGSPSASSEETVAFNHPAITQSAPARSQYEWLVELLRRRIMSFQSYPHLARMQGWEGVVVVKTTIDHDGNLIDAVVTKSSGYGALDEDAVRLMHRVCPVRLPQDLGKSKITVLVPIRYRLDKFGS